MKCDWNAVNKKHRPLLRLVAEFGMSNAQAAEQLGLSEDTVKMYLKSVFNAVGCDSRLQLAVLWWTERYEKLELLIPDKATTTAL